MCITWTNTSRAAQLSIRLDRPPPGATQAT
ncbi:hypothetical protein Ddep01_01773 [Deinococcus depolymerans]